MKRAFAIATSLSILVVGLVGSAAVVAQPRDICGRSMAATSVFAEFDLDHASDIHDHFPDFLGAPEVDKIPGTVHVVAFSGRHMGVPYTGRVGPPNGFDHVVCVVTQDGDATYYANVSFNGYRP